MAIAQELTDTVRKCALAVQKKGLMVDRKVHGKWVTVPLDEINDEQPSQRTLDWMVEQGLLRRSGSGAGQGWEVDGSVAAVMGMPEYDHS